MNKQFGDGDGGFGLPIAVAPAYRQETRVLDLRPVFAALWRGKWWIAACGFGLALLAAAIALTIPSQYQATASLLVDPRGAQVLRNGLTDRATSADMAMAEAESQIGWVKSNAVLSEVIARGDLTNDPEFGNPPPGLRARLFGSEPADSERLALRALQEAIGVTRNEMTYIIDLTVTTRDPVKSAHIANLVAEVYLDQVRDARYELVRRSSGALQSRLEDLRDRVKLSEEKVQRYREQNDIANPNGQLVVDRQLQDLTDEMSNVNARLADLDGRLQEVDRMRSQKISPETLSESLASPTISELRRLLASSESRRSQLEVSLGSRHPYLQEARANVAEIEGQIRNELGRIAEGLRVERDRVHARRDALQARVDSAKGAVFATNDVSVGLQELQRQAEADRAVYQSFLTRASELSEQDSVDTSTERLLSPAVPPFNKSWPPRTIMVLMAGMLGGALGVGTVLLREQFNPMITGADQVEQETGLPVLAVVPRRELSRAVLEDRELRRGFGPCFNRIARTPGSGVQWIFLSDVGSGKASAGATLALAADGSEAGERVLVYDADTSGAHLTALLGMEGRPGLLDLVKSGDIVSSTHRVPEDPSIHFVPSGRSEGVRYDWSIRKTGNQHEQQFDMVLINGGELWSSRLHRGVVGAADSIVLTAEVGATPTDRLVEAVRSLQMLGGRIAGVVLLA